MTSMRRLLTARHILASAGSGLAVFILFTSVIGIAVAQDDAPQEPPQTFVTTRPAFGDEGDYTIRFIDFAPMDSLDSSHEHGGQSHVESESSAEGHENEHPDPMSNEASHQEHAVAVSMEPFDVQLGFVRTGELGEQRDAQGVVHDVEFIQWAIDGEQRNAPTAHLLESGIPLGELTTWNEEESGTWTSPFSPVIQGQSYEVEHRGATYFPVEPVSPCLLRHAFQDGPVVLTDSVVAFEECRFPFTAIDWDGSPMRVIGVETEDGVASLHLQGQSAGMQLDVWLEPQVPYPSKMILRTEVSEIHATLSEFNAGTEDALAFVDTPRDALPPLQDAGRQPWGLDDTGLEHPFPVSEAYNAAHDDLFNSAFRDWATANPEHTVVEAYLDDWGRVEDSTATDTLSWHLELRSPTALGWLDVERKEVETPDGGKSHVYEYEFSGHMDSSEEQHMPAFYPSWMGLTERWEAYLPDQITVLPTQFRYDVEQDAWEMMASSFEDAGGPVFPMVGEYDFSRRDGSALFGTDGTLYQMGYSEFSASGSQQTIVDDAPAPAPNPETDNEPVAPTALQAKPDAPWVAPTPTQAAGAAGAAVLTGLLVYIWPVLKGAPFFGLFSRLRRPELLGHPSRKKILDVIEADPGIHFKELQRRSGLSNGNLVHHLRALTNANLISDVRTGGYTCYFAAQDATRHSMEVAPVLRSDAARNVLERIQEQPGIQAKELVEVLGIGNSTVHYHLKRLQKVGLAAPERDGRSIRFFPLPVVKA